MANLSPSRSARVLLPLCASFLGASLTLVACGSDDGESDKTSCSVQTKGGSKTLVCEDGTNLPAGGGAIHLSIYDGSGNLLAGGSDTAGDGTEKWHRALLNFTFVSGQTYSVVFHTNRAATATFDRMDSPTYGYTIPGLMSGVTHVASNASGDNAAEQYPTVVGNTWAPFQRLLIVQ